MLLDALVQRKFAGLSRTAPGSAVFGLPSRIVDAMTVFTEPLPLHFGDAISTLANLRLDAPPASNAEAVLSSLGLMESAYVRYCKERAAFLQAHPEQPGAGEAAALACTSSLPLEELTPCFNFAVSRAAIDRPVLSAVLALAVLAQAGASGGKEAAALQAFMRCCEWGAAV